MRIRKGRLLVALGSLVAMMSVVGADAVFATHPQPFDGRRTRVAFTPAFTPCTAPNVKHGAPLSFDSCKPPVRDGVSASDNVTSPSQTSASGLNEANAFAVIRVICHPDPPGTFDGCNVLGDQRDVRIASTGTDVRCASTVSALNVSKGNCAGSNTDGQGSDYTGKLLGDAIIRITDHYNDAGTGFTSAGTVVDTEFPVGAGCVATTSTTTGGTCTINTTADAIIPEVVKEGLEAGVEIGQIQIFDAGDNGDLTAGTIVPVPSPLCPPVCIGDGDEVPVASQGIFIP
jgi:hypothetical protein